MFIEDYFKDFKQDLLSRAGAGSNYLRSAFVEKMCLLIEELGTVPDFAQVDYKHSSRGLAVDAWSFDPNLDKIILFVSDFRDGDNLETLTQAEVADLFKKGERFISACQKQEFPRSLDESMPVTELAWKLSNIKNKIKQISIILISNARLSLRVTKLPQNKIQEIKTTYEIWDFERIFRLETSGKQREEIEIDFCDYKKEGIKCLAAHLSTDAVKSYLLVIPAKIIACLYEKYGERLLEQNVRSFLQFRGSVNKGIKNTILKEPHMFFSYNNGLSATADSVVTDNKDTIMLSARNLQIVNGGQTTASIFTAGIKEGSEVQLDRIFVQMKLTVVESDKVDDIVPRISEYSNTQNKVSAADFSSNHPFHRKIEDISRRIWAPAAAGETQQTHWFYERARGQFVNRQAGMSLSEKKQFLLQNPKSQMITKTDLAKYERTFDCRPFEVSKGAQKNFISFSSDLSKQWDETNGSQFTELWFQKLVAKAIMFRTIDANVLQMSWYGGYKANIVTYTLAKVANITNKEIQEINYLKIWETQSLEPSTVSKILKIAEQVNSVLVNPPLNTTANVTEWAKDIECWYQVEKLEIHKDLQFNEILKSKKPESESTQNGSKGLDHQAYIIQKGRSYWSQLRLWNIEKRELSLKELGILNLACSKPPKYLAENQAEILLNAEKRALKQGFNH